MMGGHCPGSAFIRTPTLAIKRCPECGSEVEVFSTDIKVPCPKCGFEVYNDIQSCIEWCKYATDCLGEEVVERILTAKEELAEQEEQSE
jgi:transposase